MTPPATKKIEHNGVKVELLGQIEGYYDRGNFYDFLTLTRELAAPGELAEALTLPFEFRGVEMQYESYHGLNVRLRYMLRVTVTRAYGGTVVKEFPFWVVSASKPPEINNPIKMEVGIEDCLHIEFEYAKAKYSLKVRSRIGPPQHRRPRRALRARRPPRLPTHASFLSRPPGCGCWDDFFPAGADQDQAHGD